MVCSCIVWGLLIAPIVYFLYKKIMEKYKFFKKRGIPHAPGIPLVGSTYKMSLTKTSFPDWLLSLTHEFRKNRFFGVFNHVGPTFVIQDPDLIKQICIKDFDHFTNHPNLLSTDQDELLSNSLSTLRDQKWKDMRATLSPAFTGSKMRMMFDLIRECAEEFVKYCRDNSVDDRIEITTKDIFSKVTLNIISTTAFGLKVDSVSDPTNPVYTNAKGSFDFSNAKTRLKFIIIASFPKLANSLGLGLIPSEANIFFKKLVADTILHRRKTKEFRPDVIQLLIQAQDGTLTHEAESKEDTGGFAVVDESDIGKKVVKQQWTDIEIAAQCFLFLLAGFDTTATLLNFAAYELAVNEDVQEKIYDEIKKTKEKLNGKPITYELLQKMEYLDAFVSEVLRVHPPGFIVDRLCNTDTEITDHTGKRFTIPKDVHIWINIYGMHHSHKYFPNPERFSPDRFMGENKSKIIPNTYIPFGVGPRACIGSRFALIETKMVLYNILSEFSVEVCDNTLVPLKYKPGFRLEPTHEMVVEFKKR